jgi:hypothetical protein
MAGKRAERPFLARLIRKTYKEAGNEFMADSDSKKLIEALTSEFHALLESNWLEFWGYAQDDKVKGSLNFTVEFSKGEYTLESAIGYGIRIKHKRCATVDSSKQTQLNFAGGNGRKEKGSL